MLRIMGSFGQRLQREREMRGITLEEIATSTKIGTRSLRALEEEDFDQLPGGIFNKGFVRAYAKYLGIDEEQAVADYLTAAGEGDQPLPNAAANPQPELATVGDRSGGANWMAVAVVVLLIAGGFAGWRWYEKKKLAEEEAAQAMNTPAPPPVKAQPVVTPAPDPNAVAGDPQAAGATDLQTPDATKPADTKTEAAAKPPELKPDGFQLEIRAKQDAWISYTTDDKPTREVQMKATDQAVSIHAQKRVKLVLGNAGGVEISHNGKTLPQLGPENKTRVVIFTPEGLQR
jgi:cytoskeleton protein RodZ